MERHDRRVLAGWPIERGAATVLVYAIGRRESERGDVGVGPHCVRPSGRPGSGQVGALLFAKKQAPYHSDAGYGARGHVLQVRRHGVGYGGLLEDAGEERLHLEQCDERAGNEWRRQRIPQAV